MIATLFRHISIFKALSAYPTISRRFLIVEGRDPDKNSKNNPALIC